MGIQLANCDWGCGRTSAFILERITQDVLLLVLSLSHVLLLMGNTSHCLSEQGVARISVATVFEPCHVDEVHVLHALLLDRVCNALFLPQQQFQKARVLHVQIFEELGAALDHSLSEGS